MIVSVLLKNSQIQLLGLLRHKIKKIMLEKCSKNKKSILKPSREIKPTHRLISKEPITIIFMCEYLDILYELTH